MTRRSQMAKTLLFVIFFAHAASYSCDAAGTKLPKLKQGMPFAKARSMLLDAGWQGLRKYPAPDNFGVLGYVYYELGYTEVVDCAGTGVAPCIFAYKNSVGKHLEVTTYGEEKLVLDTWQLK